MDAVDIVPGDVLMVRLGDIVPADIKILGDEDAEEGEETPMQVRSTGGGARGVATCPDVAQQAADSVPAAHRVCCTELCSTKIAILDTAHAMGSRY